MAVVRCPKTTPGRCLWPAANHAVPDLIPCGGAAEAERRRSAGNRCRELQPDPLLAVPTRFAPPPGPHPAARRIGTQAKTTSVPGRYLPAAGAAGDGQRPRWASRFRRPAAAGRANQNTSTLGNASARAAGEMGTVGGVPSGLPAGPVGVDRPSRLIRPRGGGGISRASP